jgi:hypothetical protein
LPIAVPAIDRRIAAGSETRISSRVHFRRRVGSTLSRRLAVPTARRYTKRPHS